MALQISKTTDQGVLATEGYAKITKFHGDKEYTSFSIELFFNADARSSGKPPLESSSYSIATPTTDLIPALYTYLKSLPEFSGAVDV